MKVNYISIDDSLVNSVINKAIFNNCKIANYKGCDIEFAASMAKIAARSSDTVTVYMNFKNEPLFATDLHHNPYDLKVTMADTKMSFEEYVLQETGKQVSEVSSRDLMYLKEEYEAMPNAEAGKYDDMEDREPIAMTVDKLSKSLKKSIKDEAADYTTPVYVFLNGDVYPIKGVGKEPEFKDATILMTSEGDKTYEVAQVIQIMENSLKSNKVLARVGKEYHAVQMIDDSLTGRVDIDLFEQASTAKAEFFHPDANDMIRKPASLREIMKSDLEMYKNPEIEALPKFSAMELFGKEDWTIRDDFEPESPLDARVFVMTTKEGDVLVDTQGYNYIRYAVKLVDDVATSSKFPNYKSVKIFRSVKEANDFMERNPEYGVLGEEGEEGEDDYRVYVALLTDMGTTANSEWSDVITCIDGGMGVMEAIESVFGTDEELCDQLYEDFLKANPKYFQDEIEKEALSAVEKDGKIRIVLEEGDDADMITTNIESEFDLGNSTNKFSNEHGEDLYTVVVNMVDEEVPFVVEKKGDEIVIQNEKNRKEILKGKTTKASSDFNAPIVHEEVLLKGKEPSFANPGWRADTYTLKVYELPTLENVAGKDDTVCYKAEIIHDPGYPDFSGFRDVLNKGRIDTPFCDVETKEEAVKLAKEAFKKMNISVSSKKKLVGDAIIINKETESEESFPTREDAIKFIEEDLGYGEIFIDDKTGNVTDKDGNDLDLAIIDNKAEAVHPSERGSQEIKLQKIKLKHIDELAKYSTSGILHHSILSAESDLNKEQVESLKKALVEVGNRNMGNNRDAEEGKGSVGSDLPEFAVWLSSDCMGETADYLSDSVGSRNAKDTYAFCYEKLEKCLMEFYRTEINKSNYESKYDFWSDIIYTKKALGSSEVTPHSIVESIKEFKLDSGFINNRLSPEDEKITMPVGTEGKAYFHEDGSVQVEFDYVSEKYGDEIAVFEVKDEEDFKKYWSVKSISSNGHSCDKCGANLDEEDYDRPGSWNYTCPKCKFRYKHGMKLDEDEDESEASIEDDALTTKIKFGTISNKFKEKPLSKLESSFSKEFKCQKYYETADGLLCEYCESLDKKTKWWLQTTDKEVIIQFLEGNRDLAYDLVEKDFKSMGYTTASKAFKIGDEVKIVDKRGEFVVPKGKITSIDRQKVIVSYETPSGVKNVTIPLEGKDEQILTASKKYDLFIADEDGQSADTVLEEASKEEVLKYIADNNIPNHLIYISDSETGKLTSLADVMPGGLSDGEPDSSFDLKSILKGMGVEIEHTNNLDIAKEIAKDHLSEDPEYYEKLEAMEQSEVGASAEPKEFYTVYLKVPQAHDLANHIPSEFNVEVGVIDDKSINVYTADKEILSSILDYVGNKNILEVA